MLRKHRTVQQTAWGEQKTKKAKLTLTYKGWFDCVGLEPGQDHSMKMTLPSDKWLEKPVSALAEYFCELYNGASFGFAHLLDCLLPSRAYLTPLVPPGKHPSTPLPPGGECVVVVKDESLLLWSKRRVALETLIGDAFWDGQELFVMTAEEYVERLLRLLLLLLLLLLVLRTRAAAC